ncbi:MAG: doubled motif LPXTG anchor domain-containing protein [Clostridium sp.]|nr:doubled motif LPXTG anchor domain-containing protein [Clostridium sp.]
MKKGVVQTKFWKRGLAATLAAAMLCGNFLEVGSSLKVFAEDGVASNAGVTVNIDTDFSTLALENVPSNVDIPLNIQVDEAELTAKTENLEEEQKSAAQNAYQAEMQAGFEQKLNELLEGKSVVDYTGAQDAPNIGVVTAVSFDENGSVDDISFIGVNTGAESREITVSLTHPIEVDKAASGLQTVELDAQLNLDAFKEEEAPDNGDQSESETETPDNGDQSESETETPDNGDQSESETQTESETETPDNGDQSEGDEFNSKNQELTPDSTPAGVTNQSASYSELTDHFSVGTNDDLSNLEDPDKETTPPTGTETPEETTPPAGTETPEETTPPTGTETPEETTPPTGTETPDDMPKNYWNISANPKVNEGTISFTEAISPAANFAVEEASDTVLISALSFMVPGESIAQVGLKGHGGSDHDGSTPIPDFPNNPGTGSGEAVETHFSASKTSSEKSGAGIYDITLMVDGIDGTKLTEEVAEQNVLFVIDLSDSMKNNRKWHTLKFAMESMTDTLAEANRKNNDKIKVGIVGYAGADDDDDKYTAAKIISAFTTPERAYNNISSTTVPGELRNENMNGGTNCEAGALKAVEMLQGQENPTTIIYLSDGIATYAYKENGEQKGDGTSYPYQSTDELEQFAREARTVLETIADKGYQIHTIGFGWNGEFNTLLKNGENITYHNAADTDNLSKIFNDLAMSITGQKVANTDVTVTDPMSEHVDIAKADGSLFMTDNKLMSAEKQVEEINGNKSALGITFEKTTYKMGPDGKPVMGNDGKPQVNDTVTVTSTNGNRIDGKNYNQLLEEVSFNAVGGVVQLTWTPGVNNKDGHKELSGKYELTYTVNVKADQDGFNSNFPYPANGETKVSGSVDGGTTSESSITVPTVQQTQNTLTIKKTGTGDKTLEGAEFVVSFTDDAGNTKYLTESGTYVTDKSAAQHFTTGENGTVTIDGLYDYVYTVEEVEAPDGYSKLGQSFTVNFTGKEGKAASGTVDQNGTVDGSLNTDDSSGEVTVQNAPSTGSITVTKELKDTSGSSIQKENNPTFIVKLTKDGNQVGNSQELKWNNTAYNTVTFDNLEADTYTITEFLADGITSADTKYDVSGTGSTIVTSGQTTEVTITNTEKADGIITVTKELKGYDDGTPSSTDKTFYVALYQGDNTSPVTNATVTKADGSTVNGDNGVYEIKANEALTFSDLPYGEYIVKEVNADGIPVGDNFDYEVTYTTNNKVTLNVNNTTGNVTITNTEKANGSITVTKELKGYNGGTPSSTDKTFYVALYQGDKIFTGGTVSGSTRTSGVYAIKANGTLTFSDLPYGTYTVKEVTEDGDELGSDFDYTVTDSGKSVTLSVNNTTGNVTITNTEKANGSITVTKVLEGYDGSTPQNKDVTFHFGLYQNERPFVKDDNHYVVDVTPTLTNGSYTGTAIFSDLPYGTYTVKEVVEKGGQWTPVGNDFDYTVTDSGTPVTLNVGNKTGSVQFTNTEKNNGQISVTKTVTEPTGNVTPAPLNGDEVFYVALYQGNEIFTGATVNGIDPVESGIYPIHDGETLTFSNLPYGNYIVKEVVKNGNNWVEVDNNDKNFDFTVTYNTQNINVHNSQVNEVTITNTRKVEGSIVLKKVIAVLSNVPGDNKTFTFQITGDGITGSISVTVSPDENGNLKADLLEVLKKAGVTEIYGKKFTITEQPHDYYTLKSIISEDNPNTSTGLKGFLEALLAPRNADTSCTFTPERDTSITITATNTAKTGSIEINKVDNAEKALPGVTFGLFTDKAATTPFEQDSAPVTATTGNDGTATFSNVPVGTYYLKETAVPEGYDVSGVIFKVTVTSNGTTTVTKDTEVVSDTQPEFTDNKLINTPDTVKPTITITKAAATGDEAFIKADSKEYTVQITGNEFSEAVTLNNAKSWTGTISDFALMPNVKYTVSETVPEGAHWALDSIVITFKDQDRNTVNVTVDKDNSFTLTPEQASKVRSIEIVVTNKANRSEAQLKVTEQVIGNLLEAEKNTFKFTVTGPDGTFTGFVSVTNGDVTNVSGWRDADSVEVAELPKLIPGETYTITQADHSFYTLNSVTGSGMDGINGEVNDKTFKFTVPKDAEGTYTVAFTNYANTIPVTLTKVLEDDALPLNPDDQFDFDITTIQDDGHAFTTAAAVTTTNSATFNLIKGKTYTIKEVAIPDGYQLVSIAMNGEVLPSTKDVNPSYSFTIPTDAAEIKLVATNRILGSYDFIKMGKVTTITQRPNGTVISRTETTNPLAGATFTLKDEDGVLLQTVESAADGKVSFNNLPAGEYIIEEASAPSGFNKWNYQIDLTLSIDGDRDMIINAEPTDDRGTEVKDYMLCIYNYREDIITEQDPPIPPTDPEDPGDPRPSGGGDETTTRTIEDTPTPTTTIDDEDVPLAPLPNDMITIDDEDVPLGDLPYTGGLPFELVGVLGIALVGAGLVLRKKNKKD